MARPKQLGEGDVVTLTIRLPRDLRDAFTAKLLQDDQQASQILRRAIRQYLAGGIPAAPAAPVSPPPQPVSQFVHTQPQAAPPIQSSSPPEVATPRGEIWESELFDMIMQVNDEAEAQRQAEDEKHD